MKDEKAQQLDHQEYNQRHFQRSIPTPDQEAIAAEEDQRLAEIISSLTVDDLEILRHHLTSEARDHILDIQQRMLGLIENVVTFTCFPHNTCKVWGLIYALDLGLHRGRNMAETARQIGSTRAALSVHAREFLELTRMPPSRWMRSETSAGNSQYARQKTVREKTT